MITIRSLTKNSKFNNPQNKLKKYRKSYYTYTKTKTNHHTFITYHKGKVADKKQVSSLT